MRLEQVLRPRLEQRLKLAPQMIQAVEILQLPLLQLEHRVNQELSENPVLELAQNAPGAGADGADVAEASPAADEVRTELDAEIDKLDNLSEDYREYFSRSLGRRRQSQETDKKLAALQNTPARTVSLQDYLMGQLRLLEVPEDLKKPCETLIYHLDADGYIRQPLEEIFAETDVDAQQALAALEILQGLDPPGIGARSLQECLLLQLDPRDELYEMQKAVIAKHLADVERNKYPKIARALHSTVGKVRRAVELIATLNPKPGALFSNEVLAYVMPDVTVAYVDGRYEIILEKGGLPTLHISSHYRRLLKERRGDAQALDYLRKKIQSAKWLIEALNQRQRTVYKITEALVDMQRDFLDKGIEHLRPLKMQEVADRVGVHVSTVSRAIADKYIQTPRGIFPMKYFFTGGTSADAGDGTSYEAIKQRISEIIEAEDATKPLSDDEIAHKLAALGMPVARRTVTKYRKLLKIPSSHRRRTY